MKQRAAFRAPSRISTHAQSTLLLEKRARPEHLPRPACVTRRHAQRVAPSAAKVCWAGKRSDANTLCPTHTRSLDSC